MSRTYKDRPSRVRFPRENEYFPVPYIRVGRNWKTGEYEERLGWYFIKKPTALPKKRRTDDSEWHWQSTPSWWTRIFMNRPQRIASKRWEREIVKYSFWDIANDDFDPPLIGDKPHTYYW